MKFCPVVPPLAIMSLPRGHEGWFAFSPAAYHDHKYALWFKGQPGPGVMDCPIYEAGEVLNGFELKKAQVEMHPDFLIVPDVRHNMEGTLKNLWSYAQYFGKECTGVIQGDSVDDYNVCAFLMASEYGLRKFALPKDMTRIIKRSDWLAQAIDKVLPVNCEIHLLGGDWPYNDEKLCGDTYPQIKSFDSAEPFNAALQNRTLEAKPPSRPANWWRLFEVDPKLLAENIKWVDDVLSS